MRRGDALGLGPATIIGIDSGLATDATIEGAGNLVDTIDTSLGKDGIIVLNADLRGDIKTDGENGTRFCYFKYKDTFVISTIGVYCLSLLKKFEIVASVNVLETREVLEAAHFEGLRTKELVYHIGKTQFRSLEFVQELRAG